jgi:hypothetical protein
MSRRSTRRPTLHDFRIGELVTLATPVEPFAAGDVVQVVGFRGDKQLRLLPIAGIPVVGHFETVARADLPCGSAKPPQHRRRFQRRRRPAQTAAAV